MYVCTTRASAVGSLTNKSLHFRSTNQLEQSHNKCNLLNKERRNVQQEILFTVNKYKNLEIFKPYAYMTFVKYLQACGKPTNTKQARKQQTTANKQQLLRASVALVLLLLTSARLDI